MFRITAVTLLIIILADSFCDTTASRVFPVSKQHIRKCRCRVLENGKTMCPYPLLPTSPVEKQKLFKCLCSNKYGEKFPEFWANCRSRIPETPI